MSRESKIINAQEFDTQATISHYESFGWELLSVNGKQITMSRETQNPVYTDLVKHQTEYEDLLARMRALPRPIAPAAIVPFDLGKCFKLLLCLIIPGVAYTVYKILKYKNYKEALAVYEQELSDYNSKKADLISKMEAVALESRGIFFSRREG